MRSFGTLTENHQDSSLSCRHIAASFGRSTRHKRSRKLQKVILSVAGISIALTSMPASGQGILESMLRGGINAVEKDKRRRETERQDRQEVLQRIASAINFAPDQACAIPRSAIERSLSEQINGSGLMDNISVTVFSSNGQPQAPTGYAAVLAKSSAESQRRQEQDRAVYSGQQVPVGDRAATAGARYDVDLVAVKAVNRVQNGIECEAMVRADFLRFPVSYTLVLNPDDSDGWSATLQPMDFTEAAALGPNTLIRIAYGDSYLTLAEAREQSRVDRSKAASAEEEANRQDAYRNSPAGRAQEAARNRALSEDYKRRGLACQKSGGTWGSRWDSRTILEVTPGEVPGGIARATLACYHL